MQAPDSMKSGKIYVNFKGTDRVRLVEIFEDTKHNNVEKVRLANLNPPGGSFVMTLGAFRNKFSEEVKAVPTVNLRPTTDPKFKRNGFDLLSNTVSK